MNVDVEELELMRRKADALGLYVNEHRQYDPCRSNGPLYVADKKKHHTDRPVTHLRYASPQMVWDLLQLAEESGRK